VFFYENVNTGVLFYEMLTLVFFYENVNTGVLFYEMLTLVFYENDNTGSVLNRK
jgi:hypothetical protein